MTDVERIAGELTDGQKRVLVQSEPTADGRVLVPSMLGNLNYTVGWPQGVTAYYSAHYSRLTPLGLRVKAHLEGGK